MKSPYIASSLLLALLAAPLALAQDAPPAAPAPSGEAAPAKPKKTELAKDMDKINRAQRTLRKQVADASQNESSLALVATIHDAAVAASSETPAWTADQPQADQAKFVADFHAKMKDFIGDIDKLSAALKAGDNAGAAKLLAGLGQDEKAGHKQFKKPEEKN
jgi:soluble cytochrome b562